jgi:hypothetical protein
LGIVDDVDERRRMRMVGENVGGGGGGWTEE